jgi:hypothetical protein
MLRRCAASFPERTRRLDHFLQDGADIHATEWQRCPGPREVENPSHRLRTVERRLLHRLEAPHRVRVGDAAGQQLRAAEDDRQHVVEVVRHARCHLAEGAQPFGLDDLPLVLRETLVRDAQPFIQARVLERNRGLVGKGLRQRNLPGVEDPAGAITDAQGTDHPILDEEWRGEDCPGDGQPLPLCFGQQQVLQLTRSEERHASAQGRVARGTDRGAQGTSRQGKGVHAVSRSTQSRAA